MENGWRGEVYRRQRGGLVPILTDRQRRRLRKNLHKEKGKTHKMMQSRFPRKPGDATVALTD